MVDSSTDDEPEEAGEDIVLRRSRRERPIWMKDYVEKESSNDDDEFFVNLQLVVILRSRGDVV